MRSLGLGDFTFLLLAMRWTLVLSAGAFVFGGAIGMLVALARVSASRPLRWLAIGYIRLLQGTPLLLQLFLVFFGGDLLGFGLGPYLSAILGLSLNAGAFLGEIWRGALQAVAPGQSEAARALGLGYMARMLRVVGPQALRVAIPPTVGFPGEPGEKHFSGGDHRLRGADPRRTDAEQRDFPAIHDIWHCCDPVFPALLASHDREPPSGDEAIGRASTVRSNGDVLE